MIIVSSGEYQAVVRCTDPVFDFYRSPVNVTCWAVLTVFLKLWHVNPFSPGNSWTLTQSGWDLFLCFVRNDLQFLKGSSAPSSSSALSASWTTAPERSRLVCGVFTSKKLSQLILLHLSYLIIRLSPPWIVLPKLLVTDDQLITELNGTQAGLTWALMMMLSGFLSFTKRLSDSVWSRLHSALCDRSMDALQPGSQRLAGVHMCSTDISCFLTWN